MFRVACKKASAQVCGFCPILTAGMARAESVEFIFSKEWIGLVKTAVFTDGFTSIDVLESNWAKNVVEIPHEVLTTAGRRVRVGVYGTDGNGVALPTIWTELGTVRAGADPSGDISTNPVLPVWAQILAQIGNLSELDTAAKESLVAAINEIFNTGGGSGNVSSAQISNIVSLSRAKFDALPEKDTRTLYLVEG